MERPPWPPGTPFPIECALYNWLQRLLDMHSRAARHEYLAKIADLHGPEVAARLRELGEDEWRHRGGLF